MTSAAYAPLGDAHLLDNVAPRAFDVAGNHHGCTVGVLRPDAFDQFAMLAQHLRHVDDFVCNRLELRDGLATGKLLAPVVGGHDSDAYARQYALDRKLDLSRSVAYGAHGPDLLLLSAVGERCAVNPDFTLRRAAQQSSWPVLDYDV